MRNYAIELERRAAFVRRVLDEARASGIVYGNSGGKDCTLVSIICKAACENTVGVILPCGSRHSYTSDRADAEAAASLYNIETRIVDLTPAREAMVAALGGKLHGAALTNLAPRLRMTALYGIAAAENRLVAGTGNRSERHMGYFTKWGDGACDFNPIADLTVTEVYEFLRYLGAPENIVNKAPSAGLYEGQTDENEMGVSYAAIDAALRGETVSDADRAIIERFHSISAHKRRMPIIYGD